jgi:hypothetical protein
MDWLHENALASGSILWRSQDGEPWIVTFDFAEVDGRLECVGMQVRSFIEVEHEDDFGSYRACLPGEVTRDDLLVRTTHGPAPSMLDVEATRAWVKEVGYGPVKPKHAAWQDSDAAWAILGDREKRWAPEDSPRPLRSTILRELPLGDLLARVREGMAANWRSGIMGPRTAARPGRVRYFDDPDELGEPLEDREQLSPEREEIEQRFWKVLQAVKRQGGWDDELIKQRDELGELFGELERREGPRPTLRRAPPPSFPRALIGAEEFKRLTQQAAGSFSAPGQKVGRPAKFSPAMLEVVARAYSEAYASGSPSPTKDVAKKLGLSRSQAAKLVMRCRDPQVGLLGPTSARRAGGIELPADEPSHPEESP